MNKNKTQVNYILRGKKLARFLVVAILLILSSTFLCACSTAAAQERLTSNISTNLQNNSQSSTTAVTQNNNQNSGESANNSTTTTDPSNTGNGDSSNETGETDTSLGCDLVIQTLEFDENHLTIDEAVQNAQEKLDSAYTDSNKSASSTATDSFGYKMQSYGALSFSLDADVSNLDMGLKTGKANGYSCQNALTRNVSPLNISSGSFWYHYNHYLYYAVLPEGTNDSGIRITTRFYDDPSNNNEYYRLAYYSPSQNKLIDIENFNVYNNSGNEHSGDYVDANFICTRNKTADLTSELREITNREEFENETCYLYFIKTNTIKANIYDPDGNLGITLDFYDKSNAKQGSYKVSSLVLPLGGLATISHNNVFNKLELDTDNKSVKIIINGDSSKPAIEYVQTSSYFKAQREITNKNTLNMFSLDFNYYLKSESGFTIEIVDFENYYKVEGGNISESSRWVASVSAAINLIINNSDNTGVGTFDASNLINYTIRAYGNNPNESDYEFFIATNKYYGDITFENFTYNKALYLQSTNHLLFERKLIFKNCKFTKIAQKSSSSPLNIRAKSKLIFDFSEGNNEIGEIDFPVGSGSFTDSGTGSFWYYPVDINISGNFDCDKIRTKGDLIITDTNGPVKINTIEIDRNLDEKSNIICPLINIYTQNNSSYINSIQATNTIIKQLNCDYIENLIINNCWGAESESKSLFTNSSGYTQYQSITKADGAINPQGIYGNIEFSCSNATAYVGTLNLSNTSVNNLNINSGEVIAYASTILGSVSCFNDEETGKEVYYYDGTVANYGVLRINNCNQVYSDITNYGTVNIYNSSCYGKITNNTSAVINITDSSCYNDTKNSGNAYLKGNNRIDYYFNLKETITNEDYTTTTYSGMTDLSESSQNVFEVLYIESSINFNGGNNIVNNILQNTASDQIINSNCNLTAATVKNYGTLALGVASKNVENSGTITITANVEEKLTNGSEGDEDAKVGVNGTATIGSSTSSAFITIKNIENRGNAYNKATLNLYYAKVQYLSNVGRVNIYNNNNIGSYINGSSATKGDTYIKTNFNSVVGNVITTFVNYLDQQINGYAKITTIENYYKLTISASSITANNTYDNIENYSDYMGGESIVIVNTTIIITNYYNYVDGYSYTSENNNRIDWSVAAEITFKYYWGIKLNIATIENFYNLTSYSIPVLENDSKITNFYNGGDATGYTRCLNAKVLVYGNDVDVNIHNYSTYSSTEGVNIFNYLYIYESVMVCAEITSITNYNNGNIEVYSTTNPTMSVWGTFVNYGLGKVIIKEYGLIINEVVLYQLNVREDKSVFDDSKVIFQYKDEVYQNNGTEFVKIRTLDCSNIMYSEDEFYFASICYSYNSAQDMWSDIIGTSTSCTYCDFGDGINEPYVLTLYLSDNGERTLNLWEINGPGFDNFLQYREDRGDVQLTKIYLINNSIPIIIDATDSISATNIDGTKPAWVDSGVGAPEWWYDASGNYLGEYLKDENNIVQWVGINGFNVEFEGNGQTIELKNTKSGLFNSLTTGANVHDLNITGNIEFETVSGTAQSTQLGALANHASGEITITNIKNYADINVVLANSADSVVVGGIIGLYDANIETSDKEIITNCANFGNVNLSGGQNSVVGGVIGSLLCSNNTEYFYIKNCYFRGSIIALSADVAGIIGKVDNAMYSILYNCISNGYLQSDKKIAGIAICENSDFGITDCVNYSYLYSESEESLCAGIILVPQNNQIDTLWNSYCYNFGNIKTNGTAYIITNLHQDFSYDNYYNCAIISKNKNIKANTNYVASATEASLYNADDFFTTQGACKNFVLKIIETDDNYSSIIYWSFNEWDTTFWEAVL